MLHRIPITGRIVAGFLLVMGLLGAASTVGTVSLVSSSRAVQDLASAERQLQRLSGLETLVGQVRSSTLLYVFLGSVNALDEATTQVAAMRGDLDQALQDPDLTAAVNDMARQAKPVIDAFNQHLLQLEALVDKRMRAVNIDLKTQAADLRKRIDGLLQGAIEDGDTVAESLVGGLEGLVHVVQIRITEFTASPSPRTRDGATLALADARRRAAAVSNHMTGRRGSAPDEIATLLDRHAATFAAAAQVSLDANILTTQVMTKELRVLVGTIQSARKTLSEVVAAQEHSAVTDAAEHRVQMTVVTAVALVLGGVLAWTVARSIVRPIRRITEAMTALATGDLSVTIPDTGRADEIGRMAIALGTFKDTARAKQSMEAERHALERAQAERNILERQSLAEALETSVMGIVAYVSGTVQDIRGDAAELSQVADQTRDQANELARASNDTSGSVHTVASAAAQLTSAIRDISRQVDRSAGVSHEAVDRARRANAIVQSLSHAVQKIGDVVGLINDIASQTNLLALNASIEAARAGEAGRGFAVVANEVKQLATQTAQATHDIAGQITDVKSATAEAVAMIDAVASIIGQISGISGEIASAVTQQGAATEEISGSARTAAGATVLLSSSVQGVAEAADRTRMASAHLLNAIGTLSHHADNLRQDVSRFIEHIREMDAAA